jgi:hypothetical protein
MIVTAAHSPNAGTQWSQIGSAWRELHEDGFRLVGVSTIPAATFCKLRGLSKAAAQQDAAAQGPVVVLAMARQNAVVRCEMKLQVRCCTDRPFCMISVKLRQGCSLWRTESAALL